MDVIFKKRIVIQVIIFIMVLSMSACTTAQTDDSNIIDTDIIDTEQNKISQHVPDESSKNIDVPVASNESILNMEKCNYCSNFSKGFAWNVYGEYPEELSFRASLIDKTGKMVLCWDSGISAYKGDNLPGFSYENGYAYLESNGEFNVIDTSGNILYKCAADSDNTILSYGDGYVITRKHYASFDSSGYIYTVYSSDGTVASQTETDYGLHNIYYCGNGIFSFYMNEETNCYFYFANTDTLVKTTIHEPILENASFTGNSKIMFIGKNYGYNDYGDYYEHIFLTTDGKIVSAEFSFDDYDNYSEAPIIDGEKAIIVTESNMLYLFDSVTKELKEVTLPYKEKVLWSHKFAYGEGKIVVPLIGDDNKQYTIVVDENGSLLLEPTLGFQYTCFSDNRMILTAADDIFIYDENMNIVYSLSQLNFINIDLLRTPINKVYYSLSEYADGVTILTEEGGQMHDTYLYLDINGNLLFESIDTSGAIQY